MVYSRSSMTDLLRSSFLIGFMFWSGTWVVAQNGYSPCSALPIDSTTCIVVDNTMAPGSGLDPGCAGYEGHDVWYAMVVPEGGTVVVNTADNGDLDDTAVAIWTGTSCAGLSPSGCDDDGGEGYHGNLFIPSLTPGDSVWIQAFGYGTGTGTFQLCVATPQLVELESSELPIVEINTLGQVITNGPKIDALMEITYSGAGNLTYPTDPPNIYSGSIGIEVRGASSAGYLQRPYGFETRDSLGENLNVSLLNMPEENDWVLLSNFNDRSLIKNQLSFRISQEMGQYAPRTHLCEVNVNDRYQRDLRIRRKDQTGCWAR
ncbi:MAG: CotH kinase family protein [Flavobacteriales bacterium]|nr:CotH kinase family protein [Flavobacteriales bacterium]